MHKRKIVASLVILLLVVAGGVMFFYAGRGTPIQVTGTLPPKDLIEIERVMRHQMWVGFFKGLSWRTLNRLPGDASRRASLHMTQIFVEANGEVTVDVRSAKVPNEYWRFKLKRGGPGEPVWWNYQYQGVAESVPNPSR